MDAQAPVEQSSRDEITKEVVRAMLREFVGPSVVRQRIRAFLLNEAMRRRVFSQADKRMIKVENGAGLFFQPDWEKA